ncbi:tetratricopeptide repeat protein [Nonomuraea sp. NPDC050790]|uniref:tetratricopeptide repeat protein n=1 Tax=Nonomuraea sp. NPDC050790 TaxID=3364371 RepID=UPI0037B6D920
MGERSVAIDGDNPGVVITGDVHLHPLPSPVKALAGLPAAAPDFTGRGEILARLTDALHPGSARSGAAEMDAGATTVVVSAVAGMAGVGKTALALVTAHQALQAGWFAGGVFFLDLHGYTPGVSEPVGAGAAAGQLLRAMGLRDADLPATGEELLTVYQSVLAGYAAEGRGVLVVADNAVSADQVQPLVPAHGCHRLLVTSRHTLVLTGRRFGLDVLDEDEAVQLLQTALAVRAPDTRVEREPQAALELVRLCGGLPLAVQIVAALLAAESDQPLTAMACELTDTGDRLNVLHIDGQHPDQPWAVRAAFDLSYRRLAAQHPERARLFRMLPLAPGIDLSTESAAELDGRPKPVVRRDLRQLASAHLIIRGPGERWGMHDLLRLYAVEQFEHGTGDDGDVGRGAEEGSRHEGLTRLVLHYSWQATAARLHLTALKGQPVLPEFADRADALTWMDTERVNLMAAITTIYRNGDFAHARHLAWALSEYLRWQRHLQDWLTVSRIGLDCAQKLSERWFEAIAWNNLGAALRETWHLEESLDAHHQAITISQELRDRHSEAMARNGLGAVLHVLGRFAESLDAYQQAITVFQEQGDRLGEGGARINLGLALLETGQSQEAIAAHQQGIANLQKVGDPHSEGDAQYNLGIALRTARRLEDAVVAYRRAIVIYQETCDRHGEGRAWNSLGTVLRDVRRFDEAIEAHQRAVATFQESGDDHSRDRALANLAEAFRQRDET